MLDILFRLLLAMFVVLIVGLWRLQVPGGERYEELAARNRIRLELLPLIEREIAEYIGAGTAPTWPGHLLARRDVPFE